MKLFLKFCLMTWIVSAAAMGAPVQEATLESPSLADLVIANGEIETLDADTPKATWLAASDGKIVALGSGDDYKRWVGDQTQLVDVNGAFVIPGLIESHGHFTGLGQSKMMLDLTTVKSWDEVVAMVAAEVQRVEPGDWIVGRGWHQEKWTSPPEPNIDGYPVHDALSAVSPNNPVMLTHASGHMCFANQYAMQLAGISEKTQSPSGGEILRSRGGMPSGVFRETAQALLSRGRGDGQRQTPEQRQRQFEKSVELATQDCWENGITSFQDAGSDLDTIRAFKSLADAGKLGVRLYVMVRDGNARMSRQLASARAVGYGDHFLTVRAIKISIDGALGPHGAWLLAPYEDMPTSVGLNTVSIESVEEGCRLALEHDYQMCIHAIGDKANQAVLDIFEESLGEDARERNHRWRIEHAQHLDPADIPRFAELGVIASMQGIHCTSDAVFVIQRLGMRRAEQGAYVWKSLLDSGAIICNGTDAPVEPIDPIASFYASVTRKLASGVEFFPEQCMTREQALRSYTLDAAYAAFEEEIKGSLTPNKLADITVLSKNLLTCPADEIRSTQILYTIVGGKIVFDGTQQQ